MDEADGKKKSVYHISGNREYGGKVVQGNVE